MAISYSWEINTLERELSSGYVTKVIYRVKGLDDSVEKARRTGEVNYTKPSSLPSDFIAYDSLTANGCITWVKDALGSTDVTAIESSLKNDIDEIKTQATGSGPPWSS